MTAAEAAQGSITAAASKSYEVKEALSQVRDAVARGERQCWLTWKLSLAQAAYIRSLGYTLTFPNTNGALTW